MLYPMYSWNKTLNLWHVYIQYGVWNVKYGFSWLLSMEFVNLLMHLVGLYEILKRFLLLIKILKYFSEVYEVNANLNYGMILKNNRNFLKLF